MVDQPQKRSHASMVAGLAAVEMAGQKPKPKRKKRPVHDNTGWHVDLVPKKRGKRAKRRK